MSFASQMSFNKTQGVKFLEVYLYLTIFRKRFKPKMIAENDYAKYNIWILVSCIQTIMWLEKSIFSEISNTWKITQTYRRKLLWLEYAKIKNWVYDFMVVIF